MEMGGFSLGFNEGELGVKLEEEDRDEEEIESRRQNKSYNIGAAILCIHRTVMPWSRAVGLGLVSGSPQSLDNSPTVLVRSVRTTLNGGRFHRSKRHT